MGGQTRRWYGRTQAWKFIVGGYLPRLALLSLGWELVQLPLYTIWQTAAPGSIAYAVAHCTIGDILIGSAALALALILSRAGEPEEWPMLRIGAWTATLALAYTVWSERLNLAAGNWAYAETMPILPWIEVGVSPLLQWLFVPLAALWWAHRRMFGRSAQVTPPSRGRRGDRR